MSVDPSFASVTVTLNDSEIDAPDASVDVTVTETEGSLS